MKSVVELRIVDRIARLIMKYINEYAKSVCYGCQIDHPSQREHTCLGIGYDLCEFDFVEQYFETVYYEKREDIIQSLTVALRYEQKLITDIYESMSEMLYQKVKILNKNATD